MILEIEGELEDLENTELLEKALRQALPKKESELKFAVLRGIKDEAKAEYRKALDKMNREILKVLNRPMKKAIDYSEPVFNKEAVAYERVQAVLKRMGYDDRDFEEGGVFYGMSTNELIEIARKRG